MANIFKDDIKKLVELRKVQPWIIHIILVILSISFVFTYFLKKFKIESNQYYYLFSSLIQGFAALFAVMAAWTQFLKYKDKVKPRLVGLLFIAIIALGVGGIGFYSILKTSEIGRFILMYISFLSMSLVGWSFWEILHFFKPKKSKK